MHSPLVFVFGWAVWLYFSDHIFFKLQNLEKRVARVTLTTHCFFIWPNMPGKKWVGRSGFYFIYLFNLKAHFCFSIVDFIYIHNGKRKLKLPTVSANLADCQFLFCFVNISSKMWKKFYRRGIVERVCQVTVNAHAIFVPVSKFAAAFLSFLQNPRNLREKKKKKKKRRGIC